MEIFLCTMLAVSVGCGVEVGSANDTAELRSGFIAVSGSLEGGAGLKDLADAPAGAGASVSVNGLREEKKAALTGYREQFDAVYAEQKSNIENLARRLNGPYELIYVHFPLNEMYNALRKADIPGASAYALESLRLMEMQVAAATNVDAEGLLNWSLNHRQNDFHFAMEGARLIRIMLRDPTISDGVRGRLLRMRDFIVDNIVEKWVTVREPGTLSHYARLADIRGKSQPLPALSGYVVMIACIVKEIAATYPAEHPRGQAYHSAADLIYAGLRTRFSGFSPPGPPGTVIWDRDADLPWLKADRNTGFDTSHGLRHIIAVRTAYEHKLPGYGRELAVGLAKLLGHVIWNKSEVQPLYTNYINGGNGTFSGHPPYKAGNVRAGWPWLAQFDSQAAKAFHALHEVRRTRGAVPGELRTWSDNVWADLATSSALVSASVSGTW